MKLVVISSRFPWPLEKGDKLRLYHQVRYLSNDFEICLIALHDVPVRDEAISKLKPYCKEIHLLPISRIDAIFNLFRGRLNGLPAQVSYFYKPGYQSRVDKIISDFKPDRVYCQLIRVTGYVKEFTIPKTIDYMDCMSLSVLKRASIEKGLMHLLWKNESRRTAQYEKEIYSYFDHHTAISQADADAIGFKHIQIIQNGIDESYLNQLWPSERDIDLLFLGNLSYFSNVHAVHFLVNEILPLINMPASKIIIAGAHPGNSIKKIINKHVHIELMANPIDVKSIYARSKIFIAPISLGTGQQNKILEALACGCAVITSPEVNQGLKIPSEFIRIANNANEYALQVLELMDTYPYKNSSRLDAKCWVQDHFSWEKNSKKLIDLISDSSR